MTTLEVRQVASEQTGNASIYSVVVRFSFVRWFRDPLPPGHQGTRLLQVFLYIVFFFFKACFLVGKPVQQHCEQGTSSSEL